MHETDETNRVRRLELVLQQVDWLPTLPSVAMRLLQLTADNGADPRQTLELVRNDPSLTARVLSLSRRGRLLPRGPATIDHATHSLTSQTLRSALLAVKVFPAFEEDEGGLNVPPGDTPESDWHRFSYTGLWRHGLAVGIAAEMIAQAHGAEAGILPAEAFTAGLLHDIGKFALAHLLPKSFARAAEHAEWHQSDISEAEREMIGLDHQTVGKRLAESWRLPHLLQDCIWLHGTPWEALPDLPHRRAVALVGVADLLVRRLQIGYSGNLLPTDGIIQRSREAGLDPPKVTGIANAVKDEVARRCSAMGISRPPTRQAFLAMVMSANEDLARAQSKADADSNLATEQARVLESIRSFHPNASRPGASVHDLLDAVADSANRALGPGEYALLHQVGSTDPWLLSHYGAFGLSQRHFLEAPVALPRLTDWEEPEMGSEDLLALLPMLTEPIGKGMDHKKLRAVALPCGWGTAAVLLHDRPVVFDSPQLRALAGTWGAGIAAAVQHQGARRLGEQLVEAHRKLADAQQTMLRNQSLARVGQVAAGAAHEMNNPLAIISGRAQLLASQLPPGTEQRYAEQIARQAERLSDMITALRLFAEPPKPSVRDARPGDIVDDALRLAGERASDVRADSLNGLRAMPAIPTDRAQLAAALSELLVNAHEARPKGPIRISASVDTENGRLVLRVADDGVGMDAATLEHAFDPFYSSKPAGRQAGLGLARARRLVEGLGGDIRLASRPNHGTTATIWVPLGSSKA